jgi:Na+/melibiose symporter-like transporter
MGIIKVVFLAGVVASVVIFFLLPLVVGAETAAGASVLGMMVWVFSILAVVAVIWYIFKLRRRRSRE